MERASLIFFLFAFTLLTSCSTKSKLKSPKKQVIATLTPGEDISFPIDSGTSLYEPIINFHQEDGKKYLIVNSHGAGKLLVFDFEKKKLSFKVKFQHDGDYGSAILLSMDSIIVEGNSGEHFYLSDTSGKIKNKYILLPKKITDDFSNAVGTGITNALKADFTGFYTFYSRRGLYSEKGDIVLREPCVIYYNFGKEDWEYINVNFPPLYYQSGGHYAVTHMWGDLEAVGNKLVVNFPASNYLTVYENGITKQVEAKADELSSIEPPCKYFTNDLDDMDTHVLQSPAYQFLIYDSYRKVYYRFLLGRQEDMSSKGDILKNYDEKPCTIVILDSTLSKIGELKLPPKTYHTPDHFVGPKGLYLSTNYVDRSGISKNMLSYRLLSLRFAKQKIK